jgi:phytanoyl-CoA hydroxylase
MTVSSSTMPDVVRPPDLTEGELAFYRNEGYLPLPKLVASEDAAMLYDEVMATMTAIGGWEQSKLMQTSEYLAGGHLDRLVHSKPLNDLASLLMEGPGSLYLPFTAVKGPQGGRFHFHQDNNYTRFDGPGINLWIALCDMSPENGCLQVVPRSHLNGTRESETTPDRHRRIRISESDFVPMRMRAGDAVAFSRLTIHGSGPNTMPGPRVGYAVQFHRNDVRYPDKETGEPVLIVDKPPFPRTLTPVDKISIPTGRTDGH